MTQNWMQCFRQNFWSQRHQLNLVVLCLNLLRLRKVQGIFLVESFKNKISFFRGPPNYSNLGGNFIQIFWIFHQNWGENEPTLDLVAYFISTTSNHQQKKLYNLNPKGSATNPDTCFLQNTADDNRWRFLRCFGFLQGCLWQDLTDPWLKIRRFWCVFWF